MRISNKNKSGIYRITNLINGKIYIGQAVNIEKRWIDHRSRLKKNTHCNDCLQRAWNKYGKESFVFEIIEECQKDKIFLTEREQCWMDKTRCYERNKGYNICEKAGSFRGYKHTDETKKKMSENNKGKNNPMYGKEFTEEHKQKISKSCRGKKRTKETREKISESHKKENNPFYGKQHSKDTRKKISDTSSKRTHTEETKRKISEANKGKDRYGSTKILTEQQVLEIRWRYENENISQYKLAEDYGVTRSCILSIIKRRTWKYLP